MNTGALIRAAAWLAEEAEFDPDTVTPGFVGFILTGALAVAVIFLGINLVRRLRRNAYRHDIRDEIEAELAASKRPDDTDDPGETRSS